jgi:hypothetical protein
VKNASQRFWVLFIGAQKSVNLACKLCKNGGGKDPTPFAKVVEDYEIYNFPIIHLVHFSWKIWRKTRSKGASLIGFRPLASRARRRAGVAHRPRRDPIGPTRRGRPRTAGPCAGAALAEPPSWSSSRAPRVPHAASTTQPRRRHTCAAPPLHCYWPSCLATAL